jgi:hypothetical protein
MFDHGSIAGDEGRTGIVDYFRLPKRGWYWYRNEYAHVPPPEWPVGGTPAALKLSADNLTLKSADGTDDAQIIVTVVDADGRALSNSPPVTLTVESGPGEFPTGPAIAFDPKSDIAIRDGRGGDGISLLLFRQNGDSRHVARTEGRDNHAHHARRTKIRCGQNAAGEAASLRPLHRFD